MQLAPMRFTKIDGTAVAVSVASAAEAKAALKELRHKKRELKFLRSALLRRQRAARAKERPAPRGRRSFIRRFFGGFWRFITWLLELATVSKAERRERSPVEMARELHRIDETLHNIDGCIVQLEGKMLTLGKPSRSRSG
jgi:hypothetical protein